MKLSEKKGGEFTPHPETDTPVKAVIVDVTPLKKQQGEYGERDVFRIVYETETEREDGTRYCMWSRNYTPSLNEKANFRKDVKKILGRDLTAQELDSFDTEDLIGMGAKLIIAHEEGKDGKVYSQIAFLSADKEPIKPSGKYVRVKDREAKDSAGGGGEKSSYRKAPTEEGRVDWQKVKVHVGKHAGVDLGDLEADAVQKLIDNWLPKFSEIAKPLKADRDLKAALEEVKALLAGAAEPEPEEESY